MALTIDKLGSPIKITGTTATSTEVYGPSPKTFVKWVYWYNAGSSGDKARVKDGLGRVIIQMRARNNNDIQCWPVWQGCEGVYVDDLDSGTLYIYVR